MDEMITNAEVAQDDRRLTHAKRIKATTQYLTDHDSGWRSLAQCITSLPMVQLWSTDFHQEFGDRKVYTPQPGVGPGRAGVGIPGPGRDTHLSPRASRWACARRGAGY